jgi:hypothetical protein
LKGGIPENFKQPAFFLTHRCRRLPTTDCHLKF